MKRTRLNKKGKSSVSQLRNKCDKLLQEVNKKRHKKCEVCGKPNQVGHHFFPKSVSSRLRYDFDNIIPLCNSCHFRLHSSGDPSIEMKIVEYRGQGWYDELEAIKRDYVKCNVGYYEGVLEQLEDEVDEIIKELENE